MRFSAALATVSVLAALSPAVLRADALADARAAYLAAWEAAPLAVSKALFVRGPASGFGQYEDRGSNVFAPDEPIRIYLEPVGYGWLSEAGQNRFGTEIGLRILTPEGQELFAQDGFMNLATQSTEKPTEFFGNVTLTLTGLEPGSYVLQLDLGDLASDETTTTTLPLEIAAPAAQ